MGKSARAMDVEQANARLPLVRAVVRDAMERFRALRAAHEKILELSAARGSEREIERLGREKEEAEDDLERYANEIRELGAEIKDLEIGLVDFPMRLGARTVLLCWKAGEPAVRFWHEVDAGFAGRRPIAELE